MDDDSELLLYSLNEFREIIRRCLEIVRPQRVLEVGGEAGHLSRTLVDWAHELEFEYLVVEPQPSDVLRVLADTGGIRLIEGKSPQALPSAGPCDVYLLDGDHNYKTLAGELETLARMHDGQPFLALLHDVAWPNARRDSYYAVGEGLESGTHAACRTAGVVPGEPGVVARGFRGEGDFAVAREEGGAKNGVLAAVEAFLESTAGFRFLRIPCLFGLGVLFPASAPWAEAIVSELQPYHENSLLARMEENRLALFLEVLHLQDSLFATKRELEQVREEHQEEMEDLRAEVLKLLEELALTAEPAIEGEAQETLEVAAPSSVDKARRVLSYDLYRSQIKARRVGNRLKQTLTGR